MQVESVYPLDRLMDQLRCEYRLVRRAPTRGLVEVDIIDRFLRLNDLGAFDEPDAAAVRSKLESILSDKKRK